MQWWTISLAYVRSRGSAIACTLTQSELLRVRVGVDLLHVLDLLDIAPRLGELDADALLEPAVDVARAGMIRGERGELVAIAVEEVAEVPGAVADVDLGRVEVIDDEPVSSRSHCDASGRIGQQLHQAHRAGVGPRAGVEPALGVDDSR